MDKLLANDDFDFDVEDMLPTDKAERPTTTVKPDVISPVSDTRVLSRGFASPELMNQPNIATFEKSGEESSDLPSFLRTDSATSRRRRKLQDIKASASLLVSSPSESTAKLQPVSEISFIDHQPAPISISVEQWCKWLRIDPFNDKALVMFAEKGAKLPLVAPWRYDNGVFSNYVTGTRQDKHPGWVNILAEVDKAREASQVSLSKVEGSEPVTNSKDFVISNSPPSVLKLQQSKSNHNAVDGKEFQGVTKAIEEHQVAITNMFHDLGQQISDIRSTNSSQPHMTNFQAIQEQSLSILNDLKVDVEQLQSSQEQNAASIGRDLSVTLSKVEFNLSEIGKVISKQMSVIPTFERTLQTFAADYKRDSTHSRDVQVQNTQTLNSIVSKFERGWDLINHVVDVERENRLSEKAKLSAERAELDEYKRSHASMLAHESKKWQAEKAALESHVQKLSLSQQAISSDLLSKQIEMEHVKNETIAFRGELNKYQILKRDLESEKANVEKVREESVEMMKRAEEMRKSSDIVKRDCEQKLGELEQEKRKLQEERRKLDSMRMKLTMNMRAAAEKRMLDAKVPRIIKYVNIFEKQPTKVSAKTKQSNRPAKHNPTFEDFMKRKTENNNSLLSQDAFLVKIKPNSFIRPEHKW